MTLYPPARFYHFCNCNCNCIFVSYHKLKFFTSSAGESNKAEAIFVILFASDHSSLSFLCAEIEINSIREKRNEKKSSPNTLVRF